LNIYLFPFIKFCFVLCFQDFVRWNIPVTKKKKKRGGGSKMHHTLTLRYQHKVTKKIMDLSRVK